MRVVVKVTGPPTDVGAWDLSTALELDDWGWSHWDHVDVGEVVPIPNVEGRIFGTVAWVAWHDDRVVLTVPAETLTLPAGADDWRLALCPDLVAEQLAEAVEEWLRDPEWFEGDGGWAP